MRTTEENEPSRVAKLSAHLQAGASIEAGDDQRIDFAAPARGGAAQACGVGPKRPVLEQLRGLGADQLAHLVAALGAVGDTRVTALIDAAVESAGDKVPATGEDAEPYMVGSGPAMRRAFETIRKFARCDAPVLITGESGTGKELAARAVHERSAFSKGPFCAINCAALPPTLIAAELFGYEKGAFTGATQRRIGRLEAADGGTIFLDEIGDLPLEQQSHLLRFLQERTIDRIGGTRPITVNARVIAATNVDLRGGVRAKRFREDLFYRLNVLALHLPPLRERGQDIELLATFFLRKFADDLGRVVTGLSDDAWALIRTHCWPGNVRELISCLRRAVIMAEQPWITALDLGVEASLGLAHDDKLHDKLPAAAPMPQRRTIDETALRQALDAAVGNVTEVARNLAVSRMTVYRLMRRFGVQ
jgi:DNA-binding NtrC family response regulator